MWRIPHSSRTVYWCLIVVKEGGPSARSAYAGLSAYKWSSRAALRQQLASAHGHLTRHFSHAIAHQGDHHPLASVRLLGAEDGAFKARRGQKMVKITSEGPLNQGWPGRHHLAGQALVTSARSGAAMGKGVFLNRVSW